MKPRIITKPSTFGKQTLECEKLAEDRPLSLSRSVSLVVQPHENGA